MEPTHPEAESIQAAAHELRNHVQSLLALTEQAGRHAGGRAGRAWLRRLVAVARALGDAAEEWIGGEGRPRDFSPRDEARRVLAAHATTALGKSLKLRGEISRACARRVRGDRRAFRTLLNNLVGNAVKFTEGGGVTLRLEGKRVGVLAHLRVTVEDTGPGLPAGLAGDLEALGEVSRRRGGSGLGLGLAGKAANRLGGRLEAARTAGGGARFSAELTLAIASRTTPAERPAGLRVLVVEDHATNRAFARRHLVGVGHRVRCAGDARTALRLCRQRRFDVALIDLGLPDMPGDELALRLGAAQPDLITVAWTGSDGADAATFAGRLGKPCARDQLVAAVENARSDRERQQDIAAARRTLLRHRARECERIDAARRSKRTSRIREEAHRAKGALALAGLTDLAGLAQRAEHEAGAGRAAEAARTLGKVSVGLRQLGPRLT